MPRRARCRERLVHDALLKRAANRVRQLIFRMPVQRDFGSRIHADQADLRVLAPDQPREPGTPLVRLSSERIDERRQLDFVQVEDDTGRNRRRHALVRKRRADPGHVLSCQREVIEAHRRIHLERLPPIAARLHRAHGAGLQIQHLILRQLHRLSANVDRGRTILDNDDQFLVERLRRIRGTRLHLDPFEERSTAPAERCRHARREGHRRQRAPFDRHAGGQRHRHGDARHLAFAPSDLVLIDDPLIHVAPRLVG